jgi:hypothetical protein
MWSKICELIKCMYTVICIYFFSSQNDNIISRVQGYFYRTSQIILSHVAFQVMEILFRMPKQSTFFNIDLDIWVFQSFGMKCTGWSYSGNASCVLNLIYHWILYCMHIWLQFGNFMSFFFCILILSEKKSKNLLGSIKW